MRKMSKTGLIAGGVMLMAALTACGSTKGVGSKATGKNGVDQVLASQVAAENDKQGQTKKEEQNPKDSPTAATTDKPEESGKDDTKVDIDLTEMSSDMIYATVYQLMFESENYVGKTIKIKGAYNATWYEKTKQYYHCVIIKDATACCSQGMEFVWEDGSHVYPDEYPVNETEVEVVGEFEIYQEDGYEYCRLKNASLKVV